MATADEILAAMPQDTGEYEEVCTIDLDARTIDIPEKLQIVGVESDEDVTRRKFKMPWKYGDVNLSSFNIRINYRNAAGSEDVYIVTDMKVTDDVMTFSWLLNRKAMRAKGSIQFVVCMVLPDSEEDDGIGREWNSTLGTFTVLEGLEVNPIPEEEKAEVIDQLVSIAKECTSKVDGGYVLDGALYLTAGEEVVAGPFSGFGGTGGGGTGNNAVMTVKNTTGWISKKMASGKACVLSLNWSSIEDSLETGAGVMTVRVDGNVKLTQSIAQGDISVDVSEYLTAGANAVRVTIADVYGNSRTISYTVTVIALSLSSAFDADTAYTDAVTYPYTPVGAVEKTVHFELDGAEIGTKTVASSGREQTYTIPMQSHGAHALRVWFTAEIEGETVESNVLEYSILFIDSEETAPIIASAFRQATAKQYDTLQIPYIVYDPAGLTAAVTLQANGETAAQLTVDRTRQIWNYRLMDAGSVTLRMVCGETVWEHTLEVAESSISVQAETSGLELYLTSYGRSNNEDNPGVWENNGVSAAFSNFNFTSDGWQMDEDGITALRVTGDARLEIPVKPFEKDFTGTGKTIEIEFATRDVLDYDAVILSCMSGGRGIEITSQMAKMTSEQSAIGTQYKENEHVRLTFAVERSAGNRFITCYINGILSGVKQYPSGDDFAQGDPVSISIGSNDCTIDLYCMRIYSGALNRYQILGNWIADTQDAGKMVERYERNAIYDDYDQIVKENLPKNLPYLVIECPVLPAFKGDKKTCSGYYVDPTNSGKSFSFTDAQIDVQGTSSQYYYVKNYKIKFKNGFTLTDGSTIKDYQLNDQAVPTSTFTFKADVASSEGANNVVLAELYNELCPVKTPPQEADERVRQTIEGQPIAVFWDNGDGIPVFAGKYNFNNDKGTPEVFGFAEGDESWEILQNGTDRVGFRSADFSGDGWKADFEARYPEDNTNTDNLAAFSAWVVSTDPDQATGAALDQAVTYDGVTYTEDTPEYRVAKFRAELPEHASVDALVFYYVFTEIFLCIDQREKNAFPTMFDGMKKWMMLFYDADSSMGTDNKGNLAFDYYLEDIDYTDAGEPVYNGQNSVLWANLRKTYSAEIEAEYKRLRTTIRSDSSGLPLLSYDVANGAFEAHQNKWPEAIFNEDGYKKSLEPMIKSGDGLYLPMLQGKKEQHRKWWLYNRFRYLDSKYTTGTSMTNRITIRAHAKADVRLTAYVNMYGHVYFNSEHVSARMERGKAYDFATAASGAEDAVIGINDADMLTSIGDLAPLKAELVDISKAVHLTGLKVGDASADYENGSLKTLTLGNNVLLKTLDVRNCTSYTDAVDASGCANIEEVYFDGTAITGISLPVGGAVKTLHLPGTVTNLTLRNQAAIQDFALPSYSQITTLRLEHVSDAIPDMDILKAIPANSRVRIIGFDWTMDDADAVFELYDRLDTMRGMDENGNTLDTAQMSGTIRLESMNGEQLAQMKARYPYITIAYNHITSSCCFYNEDGSTLLYTATVLDGGDAVYSGRTPTKASTAQYSYAFSGWSKTPGGTADSNALKAVTADRNVYAVFTATVRTYTVRWYNGDTLLETDTGVAYGTTPTYNGSTPVDAENGQPFIGWEPAVAAITGNMDYQAKFEPLVDYDALWQAVFDSIDAGTYATDYAIGDTVPLDLGSEGVVNMQIAAFDTDDLADGSGKAPITWISKELLKTSRRYNASLVTNDDGTYQEGTGSVGGWEKSEMRAYMNDTVKPLVPDEIRNRLRTVLKTQEAFDTAGNKFTQSTNDDVWIPSSGECTGSSSMYITLFEDNNNKRIKHPVDNTTSENWWLRSASNKVNYNSRIYNNGEGDGASPIFSAYIALSFCT